METPYNRGILREDYHLFHSRDQRSLDFSSHYHDFSKVVFCLGGSVRYTIEGTVYTLTAGDILIIPRQLVHRSSIPGTDSYERFVLWIKTAFVEKWQEAALNYLLPDTAQRSARLLHPSAHIRSQLIAMLKELEQHQKTEIPGSRLLSDTYLLQFLLTVNRLLSDGHTLRETAVRNDARLNEILDYINENLGDDLTIESLAEQFFLSPSYLMHRFSEYTGCPIHRYIVQRRLIRAADLIRSGTPVVLASEKAGFREYSAFLKAFKKQYLCTPNDWKQSGSCIVRR